ncbi:MAG: VIT1/CCC1 transporter family protein [Phycisphaerae bacterium]
MNSREVKKQLANLADEQNGAAMYEALADIEKDPQLAEIYRRFAVVEQRHAKAWSQKLQDQGISVPPFRLDWRTKALIFLARRLGVALVLPTVTGMEQVNAQKYSRDSEAGLMAGEEASHARLLRQVAQSSPNGLGGGELAKIEGRHRAGGGNALRAAVLGANDGLVSNLSLVMGVAGAELAGSTILVTGFAGLLAGACSMALGEWLSVQSARELFQRQIEIETAEVASVPEEEAEELALIYQSKGVAADQARQLADEIMKNPVSAVQTLTREELAIDPNELGGSAWVAAITSFVLFAVGAIIPVIPFILLKGHYAIAGSAVLSAAGLFGIGAAITLFTGRSAIRSGLRMVLFGLAAAAITFIIGRLIGVSITG